MNLYQAEIFAELAEDNKAVLVVAKSGIEAEAMVRREYNVSDDCLVCITKVTTVCGYRIKLVKANE